MEKLLLLAKEEAVFSYCGNHFRFFFLPDEGVFCASGNHFLFFLQEKADFSAGGNHFRFFFFCQKKQFFRLVENIFHYFRQKELFLLVETILDFFSRRSFFCQWNPSSIFFGRRSSFFLLVETSFDFFFARSSFFCQQKPLHKKTAFSGKKIENGFHYQKKLLLLAKTKSKMNSTSKKTCFFWQKNQKWFPLAEKTASSGTKN